MDILIFLSEFMVPLTVFYIVGSGILAKRPVIPIILVRIVSSSAAVGLILDIFKEYGPDSLVGNMVSIMMGCTETVFYTMSVYFMSAHIRKTRWTLPGALAATAAGIAASIFLTGQLFHT